MTHADLSPGSPGFFVACVAGLFLLVNGLAFLAFAIDRARAARGEAGVPERGLLLLVGLGGWPGAVLARRALGRRARKRSFALMLHGAGLILPVAVAAAVVAHEPGPAIALAQNIAARMMPAPAPAEAEKPLPHRFGPGSEGQEQG